ncbi:MAG: response regulator transcription factor [Luteolibacter sp.]|uniref:response regulator transcription factor n=1 Tax=Luteolibacter sp. TaxID=1962973 RepID=UPI003266F7E0
MKPITVLLAEDHTIVREGLLSLLKLESDIRIVAEAENGRQAVALTNKLAPDVLVMDIAMPLLNGLEAARQILLTKTTTKILILSAHSDDAYIEKVMALGASGYLIKQSAFHVLPEAIRVVHGGKTYFSPSISKRFSSLGKSALTRAGVTKPDADKLTPREMEVLQLIAEGNANKMTADILKISIKTVEKHRQSLMVKLNIHDAASLTRYAIANGIIESSVQVTIL